MDVTGFVTTNGEVYKATLNRDDTDITLTKIDSGVQKQEELSMLKMEQHIL